MRSSTFIKYYNNYFFDDLKQKNQGFKAGPNRTQENAKRVGMDQELEMFSIFHWRRLTLHISIYIDGRSGLRWEKRITMAMAVLSSSLPSLSPSLSSSSNLSSPRICSSSSSYPLRRRLLQPLVAASELCSPQTFRIDKSSLVVAETVSEDQLRAAACLRIRSFHKFRPSYGIDVSVDSLGFCPILAILAFVMTGNFSTWLRFFCFSATRLFGRWEKLGERN